MNEVYELACALEQLALGMREAALGEDGDRQKMEDHFQLLRLYLLRLSHAERSKRVSLVQMPEHGPTAVGDGFRVVGHVIPQEDHHPCNVILLSGEEHLP